MKKILILLIFLISSNFIFSQRNMIPCNDTLITKVKCYALDVKETDSGLLKILSLKSGLYGDYVTIIRKGKTLNSIGIGHINNDKYYDGYVINYKKRLYYIYNNVVENRSTIDYRNIINNKIHQDSINLDKHIRDSILLGKHIQDSIYKQKMIEDKIRKQKMIEDKIRAEHRADSISIVVKDSITNYYRMKRIQWYNSLPSKQKKAYNTIEIVDCYIEVNSVCGVSPTINYINLSDKTIKYFIWYGYIKNNVGDVVYCKYKNTTYSSGRSVGPIEKGRQDDCTWEPGWYNCEAKFLVLTQIKIIYLDGSTITLDKSQVDFLIDQMNEYK